MTSPKTLAKAMIDSHGKKWNTMCERDFKAYAGSRGLCVEQNVTLPFEAENRRGVMQTFSFQCDFVRPMDNPQQTYDVDFEVDGKGHSDKNDEWKDRVKNSQGLRVVHVPAWLTLKKNWPTLDAALNAALLSPEPTVYLDRYSR